MPQKTRFNMITLYGFGSKMGVVDPSPFVLKVDAYLRMCGLEYQFKGSANYLRRAPKGKLPYIDDNGKIIADSQAILDYLKSSYGDLLDENLTDEQRAIAYLTSKSLDENLYFCLVYSRWQRDDTWPIVRDALFSEMPALMKKLITPIIRKGVVKSLKAQGISKHSDQEIQEISQRTFTALAALLSNKQYMFGDAPSSLDAACYGFLAAFISVDLNNPFNQIARSFPTLVAYCERIEQSFYST